MSPSKMTSAYNALHADDHCRDFRKLRKELIQQSGEADTVAASVWGDQEFFSALKRSRKFYEHVHKLDQPFSSWPFGIVEAVWSLVA